MIAITNKFVAAAAVSASFLVAAVVLTSEAQGSRPGAQDVASARIEAAFAASATFDTRSVEIRAARKGDRLPLACTGEAWPAVSAECLTRADGSAARGEVRTVTVEFRSAPATSTLVRMPVTLVASR